MAPSHTAYVKDEKVLCFHHELLYEAKVLDMQQSDADDKRSPLQYRVHYKGWKNTWDDWVPADRLRKFTEENKELAITLKKNMEAVRQETSKSAKKAPGSHKKKIATAGHTAAAQSSDFSSVRGSEERHSSVQAGTGARGQKRGRDFDLEKEENFINRPQIRLPIPDHLKSLLVDDWENVTKSLQLVPLPSPHPVNAIMDAYQSFERPKRRDGSAEADILEEMVAGIKEYFDKCLGRILLYRFERDQFFEVSKWFNTPGGEWEGKGPGDVYGPEHLVRLFVSMPELIAQTNMDQQSINRMREELAKMTAWLSRNSQVFFAPEYENASQDYIEKARGM
ncbi:MAG: Esa1p-associated factor [Caeruleum heppii]|nr:MAG: Esa1p-associated factor [Caeruleum heppii]